MKAGRPYAVSGTAKSRIVPGSKRRSSSRPMPAIDTSRISAVQRSFVSPPWMLQVVGWPTGCRSQTRLLISMVFPEYVGAKGPLKYRLDSGRVKYCRDEEV